MAWELAYQRKWTSSQEMGACTLEVGVDGITLFEDLEGFVRALKEGLQEVYSDVDLRRAEIVFNIDVEFPIDACN